MKGILSKRWLLCAVVGAVLYVAMLALAAFLILRGAIKEEFAIHACTGASFAAGFFAALAYRLSGKDAFAFTGILCGCAFLLPLFLAGFMLFDGISASGALAAAGSAVLGSGAASVLFGNAKTGKKRKGRKRSRANR